MHCGQECPCCHGSYAGEFCDLKAAMLGYTKFPELDACEVNCCIKGDPYGDPCQFNIVKYLISFWEFLEWQAREEYYANFYYSDLKWERYGGDLSDY